MPFRECLGTGSRYNGRRQHGRNWSELAHYVRPNGDHGQAHDQDGDVPTPEEYGIHAKTGERFVMRENPQPSRCAKLKICSPAQTM